MIDDITIPLFSLWILSLILSLRSQVYTAFFCLSSSILFIRKSLWLNETKYRIFLPKTTENLRESLFFDRKVNSSYRLDGFSHFFYIITNCYTTTAPFLLSWDVQQLYFVFSSILNRARNIQWGLRRDFHCLCWRRAPISRQILFFFQKHWSLIIMMFGKWGQSRNSQIKMKINEISYL